MEREKWERSRQDAAADARAAAIGELSRHLAAALQTIVWFLYAAGQRKTVFDAQSITAYDTDMRAHLTATMESLVAVAHQDASAYRLLDDLAEEVWRLDTDVANRAAAFWDDPDAARASLYQLLGPSYSVMRALPRRIVAVLHGSAPETPSSGTN